MSGLFVVYSKALTGEWVRVSDRRRGAGCGPAHCQDWQHRSVGTRLGYPDGMVVSCTVTIGYDIPWRQGAYKEITWLLRCRIELD
jgi:hypothetical protein